MWVSEFGLVISTSQLTSLPSISIHRMWVSAFPLSSALNSSLFSSIGMLFTGCQFLTFSLLLWSVPHRLSFCSSFGCFNVYQKDYLHTCFTMLLPLLSSEVWHGQILSLVVFLSHLSQVGAASGCSQVVWLGTSRLRDLHLSHHFITLSFCLAVMAIVDYCLFTSLSPSVDNFQQAIDFCTSASSYQDLMHDVQMVNGSVPGVDGVIVRVFDILKKNRVHYKPSMS